MRIVLYQTWDELQALHAGWNDTLAASSSDTLFLTWEWCQAWWNNYGAGRPLLVMAAWEDGKLLGVAPFYVAQTRHWGATCSTLRIIGDGSNDSDYLDCFARVGREREVTHAFARWLEDHRGAWDLIEITGARQGSPCLAALVECATDWGWRAAREAIPCAVLPMPPSWDKYLDSLQPRFRTKVRSSLALMQQYLRSVPAECRTPDELDPWLSGLFELHSQRWGREGQTGVFRDSAKRNFYHDVSHATLQRGWLAFHRLAWGDRCLAFQYGFRYHNRFYLLQEGYDPAFEALRPGFALRSWLMRHWIERGLEAYDFLAGAAPHKLDWGAEVRTLVRLRLAANGRGQWVAIQAPQAAQELKESLAALAPPELLAWRKKFKRRVRVANGSRHRASISKRASRWIASRLYGRTPLGAIGRQVASHYRWNAQDRRLARRNAPTLQIFIYHRVNDDRDLFLYATPVSQFQAQVEHLARNFRVVTLDQVAQNKLVGDRSQHCVAITFDDGYRDNFLHAFPILKRLGISATIFLATGYIDSGELPWYDQVCLAFKLSVQPRLLIPQIADFPLRSENERLQAMQRTLAVLRAADEVSRFQLLRAVFEQLRVPSNLNLPNTMLTWQEVRRMSKEGISFGAHTITHPVLASLPGPRLQEEIFGSKKAVEDRLQLPVRHFAYPFGKPFDVGPEARRVVEEAGFETAVTTVYGVNHPAQDRFELKRFCLVEPDPGIFSLKLDWNRMVDGGQHSYAEVQTV